MRDVLSHLLSTLVLSLILLAVLWMVAEHQAETADLKTVDSYVCIQAEGNRVPNPGCRFSRAEKP